MKSPRWISLVGLGLAVQQCAQRYCTWEEILYFSWKLRIKFLVFMTLLVQSLEKSLWLKATGWNGFPESSDLNWLACLKMLENYGALIGQIGSCFSILDTLWYSKTVCRVLLLIIVNLLNKTQILWVFNPSILFLWY